MFHTDWSMAPTITSLSTTMILILPLVLAILYLNFLAYGYSKEPPWQYDQLTLISPPHIDCQYTNYSVKDQSSGILSYCHNGFQFRHHGDLVDACDQHDHLFGLANTPYQCHHLAGLIRHMTNQYIIKNKNFNRRH